MSGWRSLPNLSNRLHETVRNGYTDGDGLATLKDTVHWGSAMEWHFQSADATDALRKRGAFTEYLRSQCTPESDYDAAEVVFGELVTNVMRHAPGPIEIVLRASRDGAVMLEVFDSGAGFAIASPPAPSLDLESGRGLYIVWKLCCRVLSTKTRSGTKVSAILPVLRMRSNRARDRSI